MGRFLANLISDLKNSDIILGFKKEMKSQTNLLEASEELELERELNSLMETTLRLEQELELAVRYRER